MNISGDFSMDTGDAANAAVTVQTHPPKYEELVYESEADGYKYYKCGPHNMCIVSWPFAKFSGENIDRRTLRATGTSWTRCRARSSCMTGRQTIPLPPQPRMYVISPAYLFGFLLQDTSSIVKYDDRGRPIFPTDAKGNPVLPTDDRGLPVCLFN